MDTFIALDIGGTFIKYGLVDETGRVLSYDKMETEAQKGRCSIQGNVIRILERLTKESPDVRGIGISTAGIVDMKTCNILYANDNMPGYTGTAWKKPLEYMFHKPVLVNNDVYSAALAEAWVGAAKGADNFFCLTIGTGVGGAAFINGKLFTGSHYRAAAIGYMLTEGPWERFEKKASATALVHMAQARTGSSPENGKTIFQMAREKDPVYRGILTDWAVSLCCGIANVIFLFDPALIVVGGGISNERDELIDLIQQGLGKVVKDKPLLENIEIRPAGCGNYAGMIGAVYGFTHRPPENVPAAETRPGTFLPGPMPNL